MTKLIADISHYVTVEDWKKIKETCPFLICKATQGIRIVDSYLDTFIKGCEANHIPYWLYTYIEYATDGEAQAKYLIEKTKDKIGPYFIGYAVDAEVNSEKSSRVEIRGKLPKEAEVRKAIMYIKGLGGKSLFYGNDYLRLIKEIRDDSCAIWYPRYGKDTGEYDPAYPVKKAYEPYADLHQYTQHGKCPGLPTECDLNRLTGKRDLSWFTTKTIKEEEKTVIKIGSARIDENGKATGGKAGDQTGNEVSEQGFYMHAKGWLCFRPKNVSVANALAKAMQDACANNNIGYDQSNRVIMTMLKKYGSMDKIKEKTETDCSNLVRGCIYQATGIDVGNFNTATQPALLRKSGPFDEVEIKSEKDVCNGDILVTKSKGHTVIATSGRARSGKAGITSDDTTGISTAKNEIPAYEVGHVYTLQVELKVRTGAGTNYSAKSNSQLTADGKKHDSDKDGALDKGTQVTCKAVKNVGSDIWIQCPSGWLAAYYDGHVYIK